MYISTDAIILKNIPYNVKNKKAFILGAGGVAPSIILALKRLVVFKIYLSNRKQYCWTR